MKLSTIVVFLHVSVTGISQNSSSPTVIGEMRNVMWKGQLAGNIYLDTLKDKQNLYGLGPLEYLAGEIMILNGNSYISTVVSSSEMKVVESFDVKAPFFGYVYISKWKSNSLPDSIQSINQLEQYLTVTTKNISQPYFFRIKGEVETATIHIVNLPKGTKVSSPTEAHEGQTNYTLKKEEVEILGFYSQKHKAIFTHHDTFLHMHLISSDLMKMGHLDDVKFKKGSLTLYLPQ